MSPIDTLEDFLASQLLSPRGYEQYKLGNVSKHELLAHVEAVRAISDSYVRHRVGSALPSPISTEAEARAYALYYTTINAAKVLHLAPLLSFESEEISILDLGCGPGTASLALLSVLPNALRVTGVESSPGMRMVAQRLLSSWRGLGTARGVDLAPSLEQVASRSFDIIIAANVFAEMSDSRAHESMRQLVSALRPNGYLLLLEPGQQAHTRRLMALRDYVVRNHSNLVVQYPCLRGDPCPMLTASSTDWCHGTLEWSQPRLNAQLDELLGFNKHRIKYSAFLFQLGGSTRSGARVITPPVKSRIGTELTVCGEGLYGLVRIRKGARSEGNRALEKARVYDRLLFSEPFSGDIPPHVTVQASDG